MLNICIVAFACMLGVCMATLTEYTLNAIASAYDPYRDPANAIDRDFNTYYDTLFDDGGKYRFTLRLNASVSVKTIFIFDRGESMN